MRLRQMFEAPGKQVSFALGRLNPATKGHGLLVEALKQGPGDSILFLTDRIAKLPSDPLQANEKLEWAKKSFPDINIELAKNIMFAATELYKRGYTDVTFFEGEDKLGKLLEKYNGVESTHGMFKFNSINFERLTRNPDADDASGMSASKLRQFVIDDDFKSFQEGVTKPAQPYAEKMFNTLKSRLGESESVVTENPALYALKYGKDVLTIGKFLWNNKWLITFAVGAYKGIAWIKDALAWAEAFLDNPIVKGLYRYGLPAVGIAVALYGGMKLYKELRDADGKDEMKKVLENFEPDPEHIQGLEEEFRAEMSNEARGNDDNLTSMSKRDFKRSELDYELGHEEEMNNYAVSINGKQWKVFRNKQQANKAASTIEMKYGKPTKVYATMERPS